MRARVFILILVLAFVATLSFAGGSGEKVTPTATTAATTGPTYGGTLTQLHDFSNNEPPDWDPVKAAGPQVITWSNPVMEQALEGDIEKFGPRGDNSLRILECELGRRAVLQGQPGHELGVV